MRIVPAALLTLMLAASAAWVADAPAAWAADAQVTIKDYMFTPMTLTVPVGTKVVWTNTDQTAHTVKSADDATPFASAALDPGESYAHVFDKPGTYHVLCGLHPYMRETIVVP
jgi:plastocyanin